MGDNQHFLDTLLENFVAWAKELPACRAIVLFGSTTRTVHPADQYSDRDILLFVTDPDGDHYLEWMRQYAPLWMVIREHNAATLLWLIVYRGGYSVHLSINSVDELRRTVDTRQLTTDQERGYKSLLDKDGLVAQLPPPQIPPYELPTESAFVECVENFFYGTILIAKQLKRGNLWTVQWANRIEQSFLLKLLEWHAHAHQEVDTWHRGEHMQEWVSEETWRQLHQVVGRFDAEESWRALFASIALFRKLAHETASKLGYPYPEIMIGEVVSYLEQLHTSEM